MKKNNSKIKPEFEFAGTFRKMFRGRIYRGSRYHSLEWRYTLNEALMDICKDFNLYYDYVEDQLPLIEEQYRLDSNSMITSYSDENIDVEDNYMNTDLPREERKYDVKLKIVDEDCNIVCEADNRRDQTDQTPLSSNSVQSDDISW